MAGYITGAAKAETDQNNKAFELKLMNAKLEQEHQNRLSEMKAGSEEGISAREGEAQFSQGLAVIPNDQMNSLSKYANDSIQALRDRTQLPAPPSNLSHPAAQQSLERLQAQFGHAAAALIPISRNTLNAGGHTLIQQFDKGGNPLGTLDMGLNAEGAAAKVKAEAAYGKYTNGILSIEDKVNGFVTAQSGVGGMKQALDLKLNQLLQSDPDAKAYFDQLKLNALTVEIAKTGSSRAVQALGENAALAMPQGEDTVGTVLAKIHTLYSAGRADLDSEYQALGVSPAKDKVHPGPSEQRFPNLGLQAEMAKYHAAQKQNFDQASGASRASRAAQFFQQQDQAGN